MDRVNPVLAQKLGLMPDAPDAVDDALPPTPMRQMRRAMGRAADKAVGLSASVLGIAEEDLEVEALVESAPDDWLVIGLRDGANAGLTGLFLIDKALRSALVEMQTMGRLMPAGDEDRAITRTDAVLSLPFASQLLAELAEVEFGARGVDPAGFDLGPIEDMRTAGLVMMQGLYRVWRVTIQVGGGDRQGEVLIAMRLAPSVTDAAPATDQVWTKALHAALDDAPADLDAVLARMTLPMSKIEEFEVGQIVPLAGATVGSLSLVGPDGQVVTQARLGQIAGKRAVRLEHTPVELQNASLRIAPDPSAGPDADALLTDGTDPTPPQIMEPASEGARP